MYNTAFCCPPTFCLGRRPCPLLQKVGGHVPCPPDDRRRWNHVSAWSARADAVAYSFGSAGGLVDVTLSEQVRVNTRRDRLVVGFHTAPDAAVTATSHVLVRVVSASSNDFIQLALVSASPPQNNRRFITIPEMRHNNMSTGSGLWHFLYGTHSIQHFESEQKCTNIFEGPVKIFRDGRDGRQPEVLEFLHASAL